jgi:peptidoglycan-associated lipoprotein
LSQSPSQCPKTEPPPDGAAAGPNRGTKNASGNCDKNAATLCFIGPHRCHLTANRFAELDLPAPDTLIAHADGTDYRFACAGFHCAFDCTPSWDEEQMNIKILGALAAVALLAACSTPATTTSTAPPATAAGIVPGSEEDLVANVGDRVFYDFNASTLRADAKGTLDKQAAWLAKYGSVNVQVAGNCDERGTEEYNLALGQRRATAAASYLRAKGVAGARLSTISYGKDRPTAQGSDEQAWAQNRNAITSVR